MRVTARLLLTHVLVAAYGAVALLGYGLHALVPDDGHHHGLVVFRCAEHGDAHWHDHHHHGTSGGHAHVHGDAHHDHHHGPEPSDAPAPDGLSGLVMTSNGCAAESHLCEICAFLSQVRGERVALAAVFDWQPVISTAVSATQSFFRPALFGNHAPRGPPACIS